MPVKHSVASRVFDAIQASDRAIRYLGGRSRDEFAGDDQLQSAVYFQLMIVGEALNRAAQLDPRVSDQIEALPLIVGMRNRIVHGYGEVNDDAILLVLNEHLPVLRDQLAALLETLPPPADG